MLHNQVIADIILEIKRAPQLVSEAKYNEWYERILTEMEKANELLKFFAEYPKLDQKYTYPEAQHLAKRLISNK